MLLDEVKKWESEKEFLRTRGLWEKQQRQKNEFGNEIKKNNTQNIFSQRELRKYRSGHTKKFLQIKEIR